ncbi:MAG TPA: PAS domain S-box protein, partial [Candidatus Omnitrophota bacterium]|nr:PAS domain S-box protein [Candidatus Omnitrophota bacterium]
DWFKRAKNGETSVSLPHIVLSPFKMVMIVTAPVRSVEGHIKYVIAGQMNMKEVWEITDRVKIGETGFVFLTDKHGNFIAHPNKEKILSKDYPQVLLEKLLSSREGIINFKKGEKKKTCFFLTLQGYKDYPGQQWKIGIIQDYSEYYAVIEDIKQVFMRIALIGLVFMLIVASFFAQGLLGPIKLLARASQKIASGDLSARVAIPTNDEISDLGHAFNEMARSLQKTMVSLDVLEKEQKRFSDVAESSGEWIWEIDSHGRYIYVSDMVEKVLGYKKEDVIGHYFFDFFTPQDRERFKDEIFSALRKKEPLKGFINHHVHKYGKEIVLETTALAIEDENGAVVGYRGVNRDITEMRKAQEAIRKINEDLKSAQEQLFHSEKLAAIGQLAAGVAHEINNPLGFIGTNLEVFKQHVQVFVNMQKIVESLLDDFNEKNQASLHSKIEILKEFIDSHNVFYILKDVQDILNESKEGVDRIKKIVADLRTFSRSGADEIDFVNIEEVMESVLNVLYNELKYKAEIEKNYGFVPLIRADKERVGQVFLNLILNAAQAIEDKGVIRIRTFQQDLFACVEISDTGEGISKENIHKVFEPFFTTKPVGKGTGLGLSICYEIIHKLGGDIKVESFVGHGTTFTVLFPIPPRTKDKSET